MKAEIKVEVLDLQEEQEIVGGTEVKLPITQFDYVIHTTLKIPQ